MDPIFLTFWNNPTWSSWQDLTFLASSNMVNRLDPIFLTFQVNLKKSGFCWGFLHCEIHLLGSLTLKVTDSRYHQVVSNLPWVFQPLTTTLSSWWIGSGGQITAHLLLDNSCLPLSYFISSKKLIQPHLPSNK